ncbi:DNA polymerase family A [Dinoroseobacter phage vB_DshP-R7L]|uniref:DNA polymerase family A n=1 Tax=Dinoroseobacter phage vB_DshP-R7L TaxID=2873349 RepID=A0AAE9BMQ6_9CAUD|nr:DNA polymerase family A [Dinoroseobacter phage vB_DshP-R7L]UAT28898.1 DNA polymerase family A [Dinoroseobacter phage vB_DshP-R7L]
MNYEIIGKGSPAKIAILVPRLQVSEIKKHYMPTLSKLNQEIMVCDLYLNRKKKKTSNTEIKEYLDDLLPNLLSNGIETLIVCQPDYFKVLTKQGKTDANIGDIFDGVGGFKVSYCPHYSRVFYDPDKTKAKIDQSLTAITVFHDTGATKKLGSDIIHQATYPSTVKEKLDWLDKLIEMDCDLTCDIEGFSLKHYDAGVGTITFCWNEHEGVAFEVDNTRTKKEDPVIRQALKTFFKRFKHRMIYHNVSYDAYVLIYQLFMDHILDQEGLLEGLEVMLKNWECTQIITYLATNSCAGNELGLKAQAQEFAGNYAVEDIKDITLIPLEDLLEYNLVDGLSTWFVYHKHWQTMLDDQQMETYQHFKEWTVDIIQMQLTGLPVNMDKVVKLNDQLTAESEHNVWKMMQTKICQGFQYQLEEEALAKKNAKLKTKQVTRKDLGLTKDLEIGFNPGSAVQLQRLLYSSEFLGLPVLDLTDSGLPSTGADTLEKLLQHPIAEETKDFLKILLEYKASAIILSTFLPAFLKAHPGPDGWHYLFGNFRLGGTLSGRLSSNNPNLQNIPSSAGGPLKSRLAKLIKECFEAPPGWLFVGLDFDSLEDRISALQTKDPEKLKVYTDGYDGHSLRAYGYFGDQMPDIDPSSVDSINSIAKKYKPLRQESKAPTFALTYQGTFHTLMNNCGFSKEKAQMVESKYKKMYQVSIDYVNAKLEQATHDGYITVAFGLRVRTPLLKQTILGTNKTPKEAAAEGRTAGNAMGQSYCMLNSRAASAFMKKVRRSSHRLDIKPCAHIHDAQYYLVRDGAYDSLVYINTHLPKEVAWQDDPEIWHDEVKLSGSCEIFYPNWNHGFDIPNGADVPTIKTRIKEHLNDLKEKGIAA